MCACCESADAAERVSEAEAGIAEAAAKQAQAEARAESAEEAKIELSLKLAQAVDEQSSAADVSGVPSKRGTDTETEQELLQKR